MCGLFGIAGRVRNQGVLLRALAIANQARGKDSCGLALVDSVARKVSVRKRVGAPLDAAASRWFNRGLDDGGYDVAIGHTRWSTHGAVTRENAHPFLILCVNKVGAPGQVVGAHNGVCVNHGDVAQAFGLPERAVDSQTLIDCLGRDVTGSIYTALGRARGKLNLSWWDSRFTCAVRLLCAGNPLHYAEVRSRELGDAIVWSSQSDHLEYALAVAGLRAVKNIWRLDDYEELRVERVRGGVRGQLYQMKPAEVSFTVDSWRPLPKMSARADWDWDGGSSYTVAQAAPCKSLADGTDEHGASVVPVAASGDVVVCVNSAGGNGLCKGSRYRVTSVSALGAEWYLSVVNIDGSGVRGGDALHPSRFQLAATTEKDGSAFPGMGRYVGNYGKGSRWFRAIVSGDNGASPTAGCDYCPSDLHLDALGRLLEVRTGGKWLRADMFEERVEGGAAALQLSRLLDDDAVTV